MLPTRDSEMMFDWRVCWRHCLRTSYPGLDM